MITIVTWNVNSIRSRLTHVLDFLANQKPDILLLQELKVEESAFPYELIDETGYQCAVFGQKTYNGVAIISRYPLEDIHRGLPCDESTGHARYIEATVMVSDYALRVASVYVPNGQAVESDKFRYKLSFLQCLNRRMQDLLNAQEFIVIGGDYNVAPRPIDVYDPKALDGTVCFHADERAAFRRLCALGFTDAWRSLHPEQAFSWWDYRQVAYERNLGLRIDHLLLSPEAADRLHAADIRKNERELDKPSDHAPVRCFLAV